MRLFASTVAVVALVGLAAGCVAPRVLLASAVITNWDQSASSGVGLRVCVVKLGWTREELHATCGKPQATASDVARPPGLCDLYRSYGHPLHGGGSGAPWIAVCWHKTESVHDRWVKDPKKSNTNAAKLLRESTFSTEVYDTHGLQDVPAAVLKGGVSAPLAAPSATPKAE